VCEREFHDEFYERDAERIFSSPLYGRLLERHARFLLEVTPHAAVARVLSVGCGDGRREVALAPQVRAIVGTDLSPVAIDKAAQRAQAAGVTNAQFLVGDGVPERHAPFDAIWCLGVLHHLPAQEMAALLQAARRALAPGGCFVSMDPNAGRFVGAFKPLVRRAYGRFHSPDERELHPRAVMAAIAAAGFVPIGVRYTDAFISPLAWLYPQLPERPAAALARLDELVLRVPPLARFASGFAVVATAL